MTDKRALISLTQSEKERLLFLCENLPAEDNLRQRRAQEIAAFAKDIGATQAYVNADQSDFLSFLKAALEAEGEDTEGLDEPF